MATSWSPPRSQATSRAGGLRVPTTAEVAWELPEGPFTYFRGRVTALQVD